MSDDVLAPPDQATVSRESARAAAELRTFLIADIRGYTSFTQRSGDERAAALVRRFAACTRDVVEPGGTVLELRGDEAVCAFASPRQALRAAVALQRRLVEETWQDPELPLPVGIGMDVGEVVAVEGGYRGGALNLAARLCAMAGPGEILATVEVTHLAQRLDGVSYEPRDSVKIKGFDVPVRPVRVVPEQEDPARQLAALHALPPKPRRPRGPRWLPPPLRRRPVLAVGAAAVATAVVATLVVVMGGRNPLTSLSENVAGLLDPAAGALADQVAVGANPTAVADGFGALWVVNTDNDSVSRIDPPSRKVVQSIDVGSAPTSVAIGDGSVWVSNSNSGTVTRIDPGTGNVRQTFPVGAAPAALAYYQGALWVTDIASATVLRVDPATDKVTAHVAVGDAPSAVVAGDGHVWVSNSGDGTVSEIDPEHNRALPPVTVGKDPRGMALDGGTLWVANNLDGTVSRVDTASGVVDATIPVGSGPVAVAATAGKVWVADQDGAALSEVDPASNTPLATVSTASQPAGVVAAGRQLWVVAGARPALHRGGTFTADIGSLALDPAYLDGPSIPVARMLYDGLVALRRAPGAAGYLVVPDLAVGPPTMGDGGLSYAFRLRRDVRWSTGAPVIASDIRRGIERAVAAGGMPDLAIVGADTCTTSACDLSTGVAVDDAAGTVTIRLSKPEPEFLDWLAGAVAVPTSTPLTQLDGPLPTTGPYRVAAYHPNASHRNAWVAFDRNPFFREWSHAAQPAGFPERLEFTIQGKQPTSVPTTFDWIDVRGADLGDLQARFGSDRVKISPQLNVRYLFLNTSVPPFNVPDARRAVSYAIDRDAVKNDWPAPATVTCQILPPTVPGYRPYCPYTLRRDATGSWYAPDLATAQQLVRRSGTAGASVTVWTLPLFARGMQHVVDAMNDIGYQATLQVVSDNYFNEIWQHPEVQAGFVGWIETDPSPSGFTNVSLCAAIQSGQNYSRFCDPSIDARIADALALQAQSPQQASDAWAQVDQALTDAAPLVPLLVADNAALVSSRVRHYEIDNSGPIYDELWLK